MEFSISKRVLLEEMDGAFLAVDSETGSALRFEAQSARVIKSVVEGLRLSSRDRKVARKLASSGILEEGSSEHEGISRRKLVSLTGIAGVAGITVLAMPQAAYSSSSSGWTWSIRLTADNGRYEFSGIAGHTGEWDIVLTDTVASRTDTLFFGSDFALSGGFVAGQPFTFTNDYSIATFTDDSAGAPYTVAAGTSVDSVTFNTLPNSSGSGTLLAAAT